MVVVLQWEKVMARELVSLLAWVPVWARPKGWGLASQWELATEKGLASQWATVLVSRLETVSVSRPGMELATGKGLELRTVKAKDWGLDSGRV